MKKFGFICFFLGVMSISLWAQGKVDSLRVARQAWEDLDPAGFKKVLADTLVVLLDVRTPAEYRAGHITNARNMDVRQPAFEKQIETLDPKRPVAVYCRSGVRSRMAAGKLVKRGFKVYNLDKGYFSWPDK